MGGAEESVADWAAVARAVDDRVTELGWPQGELARRAGLGRTTVREIQHHTAERPRNTATLQALSRALQWPPDRLATIATSGSASSSGRDAGVPEEASGATNAELVRRLERLAEDVQEMLRLARQNC